MARSLSISYDPVLLATRQQLLENMGHTVISAEGFARAYRECEAQNGDLELVILGHSIPHDDNEAIIGHCPKHCSCPVLALLRPNEPLVRGAAMSVDPAEPRAFIDAVEKLLPAKQ